MKTRDPRRWAALSYSVGLISGLIVLAVEKRDTYIRFHAWQSVLAFAAAAVISMLLPSVPVIGDWRLTHVVFRLSVIALYILLIFKGLSGERYKLPVVGELADKMAS